MSKEIDDRIGKVVFLVYNDDAKIISKEVKIKNITDTEIIFFNQKGKVESINKSKYIRMEVL